MYHQIPYRASVNFELLDYQFLATDPQSGPERAYWVCPLDMNIDIWFIQWFLSSVLVV